MSKPRTAKCYGDGLEGCSGNGRPTCTASECMFGVEPCPECGNYKPVSAKCNFVHSLLLTKERIEGLIKP